MSGKAYSMIVEGYSSGRREKLPKGFLLGDVMKQSLVGEYANIVISGRETQKKD
jgi:hypothetical protein